MTLDPTIFDDPRAEAEAQLRAAPPEEVATALLAWLDSWLPAAEVDAEALWWTGTAVGRAGVAGLDRAVCQWLQQDPTLTRRIIAASFLDGYWGFVREVHPPCLQDFLASLDQLPRDSYAYAATLLALHKVASSPLVSLPPARLAELRQTLLKHLADLERTGTLAGIAAVLAELRATAR